LDNKLWRKSVDPVDHYLKKLENPTPTEIETTSNADVDEASSSNNKNEKHSNNNLTQSQISPLTIDYFSDIDASTQKEIEESNVMADSEA
jgi:hypothetical protein